MDPVPQTIRKVRTFADDVARAGGTPPRPSAAPTTAETPVVHNPLQSAIERAMDVPEAASTPVVKPELAPAFDIREDAALAAKEATIIRDNKGARWSFTDEVGRGMSQWFQELKDAFARPAPVITMEADIAPVATPQEQPPASTSVSWKRISEPRMNAPLPHTTEAEATAYRSSLYASLKPRETQKQPEETFKQARAVRPHADPASARARLAALAETVADEQQPAASRDIPFIPPHYQKPEASPVRTLRTDALTDIKTQNLSAPQIAAKEMERRTFTRAPIILAHTPSRTLPVLAVFGTLLIMGALGTIAYTRLADRTSPPPAPSYGFFDTTITEEVLLPGARTTLLETLTQKHTALSLPTGGTALWHLTLTDAGTVRPARTDEFMRILDPRAPHAFIRALEPAMMVGAYGTQKDPYLIFKVTSFEEGFAGMLAWEPQISADLAPLFGTPVRRTFDSNALTLDRTRPAYFVDEVIQNTDVRLLRDETGAERLLYAFPDPETILITTSASSLEGLLRSLR